MSGVRDDYPRLAAMLRFRMHLSEPECVEIEEALGEIDRLRRDVEALKIAVALTVKVRDMARAERDHFRGQVDRLTGASL